MIPPLGSIPVCRACDLVTSCAPVIEGCLATISASMGIGLFVYPGLMDGSRALAELLQWMPQWAWATVMLAIAAAKLASIFVPSPALRIAALMVGVLIWTQMTISTATVEMPVLAPWYFGPLALIDVVTLIFVGWDQGRRRALR